MKYLIVGLGNPGAKYENTRHNIGFKVLDAMGIASNSFFEECRHGWMAQTSFKSRQIILLKPNTYMNLSGKAVAYWMQQEKIKLENIFIITDDLALPYGTIRIRGKGSDGGHNGLKDIQRVLGTPKYARLRFGVGADFQKGQQVDYVLGEWNQEESKTIDDLIKKSADAAFSFTFHGLMNTMNKFNG
ncbi:aminoacyl-tRNA hydrolase [Luteibaculum oceani]|uniref:Peptidyl-tRNA hydrolase n=1 Tax=Luteibaculum oceani TaxID=1294296 RepID=A0A5C6VNK6_9FLAO|nr:aminoacyl-tRNA hydrolase [Luteibaculum oceani]TXC85145.1 aminoacyl-tRNA hydrolase [Luteibaculum oceani]